MFHKAQKTPARHCSQCLLVPTFTNLAKAVSVVFMRGQSARQFVYCFHRAAHVSVMNWAVLRQKHRERPEREESKKRGEKRKKEGRGETDRKCDLVVFKKQANCDCVTDNARGVDKMLINRSFKNSLARKLFRYIGKNTGMILA